MTSAFHVRQETSGPGLYDIDKVEFRVTQSRVKKWEVLLRRKYTDNYGFPFYL